MTVLRSWLFFIGPHRFLKVRHKFPNLRSQFQRSWVSNKAGAKNGDRKNKRKNPPRENHNRNVICVLLSLRMKYLSHVDIQVGKRASGRDRSDTIITVLAQSIMKGPARAVRLSHNAAPAMHILPRRMRIAFTGFRLPRCPNMSIDTSLNYIHLPSSHLPTYRQPTCHITGTNGENIVSPSSSLHPPSPVTPTFHLPVQQSTDETHSSGCKEGEGYLPIGRQ